MELVDTHCHIHEAEFGLDTDDPVRKIWLNANKKDPDAMITAAKEAAVKKLICVGTTVEDSQLAVEFVQNRKNCWASIGIHPHEAKEYIGRKDLLEEFASLAAKPRVVAVGECGLDYFYRHSPKDLQIEILKFQIELALEHDLPMIFHVRDAFDDFWPIFESYQSAGRRIRGVLHSFTDSQENLERATGHGLFVGVNGIATFTKKQEQLDVYKAIPLQKLLLETDAPFLTPTPYRGTICEPKHVRVTAEFLSKLRGESLEELAAATTMGAQKLFRLE